MSENTQIIQKETFHMFYEALLMAVVGADGSRSSSGGSWCGSEPNSFPKIGQSLSRLFQRLS